MCARKLWTFVVLASLFSLLSSGVWATERPGHCSVATLRGTFGDFDQGTVVGDIGFVVPPPFPALVAGVVTYDGRGQFTSTFFGSFAGFSFQSSADGTYDVKHDCTYSDYLPSSNTHSGGVITGEGMQQEIHFVYTDASVFASGTLKRAPQWCSLRSVAGKFALFGEGTFPFPPAGTPVQTNHVGTVTFDGAGHFSGHETVNIIGNSAFESDFTGTYTVNKDCTVTAEIISPILGALHEAGEITGTDMNQEIHTIVMDLGWSFADTLRRQ